MAKKAVRFERTKRVAGRILWAALGGFVVIGVICVYDVLLRLDRLEGFAAAVSAFLSQ